MADSMIDILEMRVLCQPRQLSHNMLEEHLMLHFDQIKLSLSALPHRRIKMLQRLKQNFHTRTTKTDIYTQGLANNLIDTIIEACALRPDNLESQLWRLSYFLSSWQVLCATKAEFKMEAWERLERELVTAPDVLMVPSLFHQISETHHKMATMMQNAHRKADYSISLTITP